MKPKELDAVRLIVSLVDVGIQNGSVGIVVALFDDPNEAYEVEFCDADGSTIEQVLLRREQFEVLGV